MYHVLKRSLSVEYVLAVSAPRAGDTVTVELEHETDGTRWVGTFAAKCECQLCPVVGVVAVHPVRRGGQRRGAVLTRAPACARARTDVEEITRKTGNFKRFPVFLKMLVAAVNRESDSVFIDLLTYADLVRAGLGAVAD